jgi:2-polyprenyl-3-methyl-5-hydroxy-6-metoxy-1,4-benzoquinol methylase
MSAGPLRCFYEKPSVVDTSVPDRPLPDRPATDQPVPDRARRQARILREMLRDLDSPASIVDIGCGDAAATIFAARINPRHRIVGLDWSAEALRRARSHALTGEYRSALEHRLALIRAEAEPAGLPIASGRADVVIMSELIEHLVDPDSVLDEVRRVLKPGGTLLLSTPNLAAWYNRGLLAFGVQPVFTEVSLRDVYGRPGSQVAGHLRLFTRRALVGLLTARGFGAIRVSGACYHDVPRPLRPLDQAFRAWPAVASILLARAVRT